MNITFPCWLQLITCKTFNYQNYSSVNKTATHKEPITDECLTMEKSAEKAGLQGYRLDDIINLGQVKF